MPFRVGPHHRATAVVFSTMDTAAVIAQWVDQVHKTVNSDATSIGEVAPFDVAAGTNCTPR